jgi:hypothetical protein
MQISFAGHYRSTNRRYVMKEYGDASLGGM